MVYVNCSLTSILLAHDGVYSINTLGTMWTQNVFTLIVVHLFTNIKMDYLELRLPSETNVCVICDTAFIIIVLRQMLGQTHSMLPKYLKCEYEIVQLFI